jgi:hypothetical protein
MPSASCPSAASRCPGPSRTKTISPPSSATTTAPTSNTRLSPDVRTAGKLKTKDKAPRIAANIASAATDQKLRVYRTEVLPGASNVTPQLVRPG